VWALYKKHIFLIQTDLIIRDLAQFWMDVAENRWLQMLTNLWAIYSTGKNFKKKKRKLALGKNFRLGIRQRKIQSFNEMRRRKGWNLERLNYMKRDVYLILIRWPSVTLLLCKFCGIMLFFLKITFSSWYESIYKKILICDSCLMRESSRNWTG